MQFPGIVVISEGVLGLFPGRDLVPRLSAKRSPRYLAARASLQPWPFPTLALGLSSSLLQPRTSVSLRLWMSLGRVGMGVIGGRIWLLSLLSSGYCRSAASSSPRLARVAHALLEPSGPPSTE